MICRLLAALYWLERSSARLKYVQSPMGSRSKLYGEKWPGNLATLLVKQKKHMRWWPEKTGWDDLPGGSFDANMTFAQAITEAASAVPDAMVVAAIPQSDIEIGGEGGKAALERIRWLSLFNGIANALLW